jgi:hypothetical protein
MTDGFAYPTGANRPLLTVSALQAAWQQSARDLLPYAAALPEAFPSQ